MKIFVIIVTYNPMKWIERCLNSLLKSDVKLDIVVVDNGSNDGGKEYIKKHYKFIHLIELEQNLGFGAANNVGLKFSIKHGADYYFLLNQDAYVIEDTISKLVQKSSNSSIKFGIVSPLHLNGNGTALDYEFSKYISAPNCPDLISDKLVGNLSDKIYEIEFVNAACWLLTKECVRNVGGFSPVFFHYGEDNNYVDRIKYHGFKVGVYPETVVLHDRENRTENLYFDADEYQFRKKILTYSNPNINTDIRNDIKKISKACKRSLLKINLSNYYSFKEKLRKLKDIQDEINKCKEQSKQVGTTFL